MNSFKSTLPVLALILTASSPLCGFEPPALSDIFSRLSSAASASLPGSAAAAGTEGGYDSLQTRLRAARVAASPKKAMTYRLQKAGQGLALESSEYAKSRGAVAARVSTELSKTRADRDLLVRRLGGRSAVESDPEALHRFSTLVEWERQLLQYAEASAVAFDAAELAIDEARTRLEKAKLLHELTPETFDLQAPVPEDLIPHDLPEPPSFRGHLDEPQLERAREGLTGYQGGEATAFSRGEIGETAPGARSTNTGR